MSLRVVLLSLLIIAPPAMSAEQADSIGILLERHHAINMSTLNDGLVFYKNPFAYENKLIFLGGAYQKHIGPDQAIVSILPARDATTYAVQWDTRRNLAELAVKGKPFIRCVVKVLGTVSVQQGLVARDIPHVREVECLP